MGKQSQLEEDFATALRTAGILFARQYKFDDTRRRADFFIQPNYIVECQGLVFWGKGAHNTAAGVAKDLARHNELTDLGYTVLYVTNKGNDNTTPEYVSALLKKMIGNVV